MASIGIIANPASGKDIRRLVSYATVIDNNEKVNITKRIVLAAQATGIDTVYFMPDTYCMGFTVHDDLMQEGVLRAGVRTIEMKINGNADDSTAAAEKMEKLGVGCIVVLGGDGTSRAVAKGITDTPILPISTGTNNVYPRMFEGTVAGMAASAAAQMTELSSCCIRDKRIELSVNGNPADIALIDAVVSNDLYSGAKAIWDYESLRFMAVTRCHPASIGFSAIAGCLQVVRDTDDYGFMIDFDHKKKTVNAAVAAGVVLGIGAVNGRELPLDQWQEFDIKSPGMVALDGERELKLKAGDRLSLRITRNGPLRVSPYDTVEQAMKLGMYKTKL